MVGLLTATLAFSVLPNSGVAHASPLDTTTTAAERLAGLLSASTGCEFHSTAGSDVEVHTLQGMVYEYGHMEFYVTDNPNPGLRCSGTPYGDKLKNKVVIIDQRVGTKYTTSGSGINSAEAFQMVPIPVPLKSVSDDSLASPKVTVAGVVRIQYQAIIGADTVSECAEEQYEITALGATYLGAGGCAPA